MVCWSPSAVARALTSGPRRSRLIDGSHQRESDADGERRSFASLEKGAALRGARDDRSRYSDSSEGAVSGGWSRPPETAGFVEEQPSRPALPLLVPCGRERRFGRVSQLL